VQHGHARSQKRDYLGRSNQIAKHSKARLVTIMITTKASSDNLRTPSISSKTKEGSRRLAGHCCREQSNEEHHSFAYFAFFAAQEYSKRAAVGVQCKVREV
jgi:hypothetical protein